ncbi:hypothetical protein RC083_11145 [Pseudoalteromonas haloplanktis]|uniref:Uncharacterized protein n=1 Tax=Pseudoalteromonas haloplanktis TaxID=228 RepID=A0ABU1BCD7_PSEHA|nr:hypothetical protein [Pseudoalteromonas haloplanktis]MDQ9092143.1 hypothetical protein [Pseudoalteromonas haloplanktis]
MNHYKYHKSLKQQGVATITILLFVGMAVSVAVFGAFRFVQGSQSQAMTFHAQTQAQRKAWSGVDITVKYLDTLSSNNNLGTLIDNLPNKDSSAQLQQKLNVVINDPNLKIAIYKEETKNKVYVYTEVTGEAAKNTKAHAVSTVEAIFELKHSSASKPTSCLINRTVVMRGVTDLTGGGTDFLSGDILSDIAVEGDLTLSNSSKSGISGCVSGDTTMDGGGIKENATLRVSGNFYVNSMSPPKNASVWASNISIGNSGSGEYNFLRAGAYEVALLDERGNRVGNGAVGGKLIASTANSALPWSSGVLIPIKEAPFVVDTLSGGKLLVDLGEASINESDGFITGHLSEVLEGEGSLPSKLQFVASGLVGGDIDIFTLKVNELWGNELSSQGYDANYKNVFANGDFKIGTGTIGKLIGGGDLTAIYAGCNNNSNCWNTPTITNPSQIAGVYNVSNYNGTPNLNNLTSKISNLSPGLPGIPFCDTRVEEIKANNYKSSANYIFEEIDSKRQLTIQNVVLADGTKLDGVYNLLKDDLRTLNKQTFLSCGWGNGHCFRNNSVWELNGISAFPPGVAWFDNSLVIAGVGSNMAVSGIGNDLLNTIITAGDVNLTSSGHGDIIAPNFNPAALCQGSIIPTNLCKDGELVGEELSGLPIANSAIISENTLSIAGWSVSGHVTLGGGITTSANKVVINGGLVVGSNKVSGTIVGQGGLEVNTKNLTQGQLETSCSDSDGTDIQNGWQLKQINPVWTRYL